MHAHYAFKISSNPYIFQFLISFRFSSNSKYVYLLT